jgi:hypothetical protein
MTCAAGCATQPPIQIIGECAWVTKIEWTMEEGDAIVKHAPRVARQLLAHNKKVEVLCDEG